MVRNFFVLLFVGLLSEGCGHRKNLESFDIDQLPYLYLAVPTDKNPVGAKVTPTGLQGGLENDRIVREKAFDEVSSTNSRRRHRELAADVQKYAASFVRNGLANSSLVAVGVVKCSVPRYSILDYQQGETYVVEALMIDSLVIRSNKSTVSEIQAEWRNKGLSDSAHIEISDSLSKTYQVRGAGLYIACSLLKVDSLKIEELPDTSWGTNSPIWVSSRDQTSRYKLEFSWDSNEERERLPRDPLRWKSNPGVPTARFFAKMEVTKESGTSSDVCWPKYFPFAKDITLDVAEKEAFGNDLSGLWPIDESIGFSDHKFTKIDISHFRCKKTYDDRANRRDLSMSDGHFKLKRELWKISHITRNPGYIWLRTP